MIHIDGDLCVYAVASACEGKRYRYKGIVYDSKLELNKILKADGTNDSSVEFYTEPESWDSCRTSAISYLEAILDKFDDDCKIYLSGKSNFRYQIATIKPYKGNRGLEKPVHFDAVRQFYVDYYGAVMSVGMEADDLIGLNHDPDTDVIATRDKDLDCVPGIHYDWVKDSCRFIQELEADRHFYSQVLTGDATDNVLGLYGVSKDSKLLKNLKELTDPKDMFDFVRTQYESRFGSYWKLFMKETCELVWIKQKRKETWRAYFGMDN